MYNEAMGIKEDDNDNLAQNLIKFTEYNENDIEKDFLLKEAIEKMKKNEEFYNIIFKEEKQKMFMLMNVSK